MPVGERFVDIDVTLILSAVIVLVLFDLAAARWGADSRPRSNQRNWW